MGGPWEKYQKKPWEQYASSQEQAPVYSGTVLPFSKMPDGSVQFDSDAGLLGTFKRAVMFPGEVYRGEVQLNDPATGELRPEVIGRAFETAAVMTPVNPAVRSGDKLIGGLARNVQKKKATVPTAKELLQAGSKGFDDMRATGAQYPSAQVKRLAETLMARMNEQGFDDATATKTFRTLGKLASPPPNSTATIGNLHSARKTFGKIAQNFNDPSDQAAARRAIDALDEFISGSGAAGPRSEVQRRAGEALRSANANFAAGKRSDLTQGIERAADFRASAANSGQNTGNAIRQRVASALLKEKDTAGFSPSEKDLLEGVVKGSRSANLTRDLGNTLGGGGGLGGLIATGAGTGAGGAVGSLFGAPVGGAVLGGASVAGAGRALKGASNSITRRALQQADEAIRMRSPLFEQRVRQAPVEVIRDAKTEALIRMLLLSRPSPQQ